MINMVCGKCGSSQVMKDAWAEWCLETQQWELSQTFDDAYCEDCEGECSIDEVVLSPEKAAEIAEDIQVHRLHTDG
jgi:hypothetical protein